MTHTGVMVDYDVAALRNAVLDPYVDQFILFAFCCTIPNPKGWSRDGA